MISRRRFLGFAAGLAASASMPMTARTAIAASLAAPTRFVAGTTLIADILSDLMPDAGILTLAQGSSCPTHSDMKSSDAFAAADADMLLIHAFQSQFPAVKAILTAADHPGMRLATLDISGNWMTPPVQQMAVKQIAKTLSDAFPSIGPAVENRLKHRLAAIDAISLEIERTLAGLKNVPVMASVRQADFLSWAGLDVKATYLTAQDLSPLELIRLVRLGRDTGVRAVIDNRQSGADLGGALAAELKVPHITLSNFPMPGTPESTFFTLLSASLRQLSTLSDGA